LSRDILRGYSASKSGGWRCDWEREVKRRPPAPAEKSAEDIALRVFVIDHGDPLFSFSPYFFLFHIAFLSGAPMDPLVKPPVPGIARFLRQDDLCPIQMNVRALPELPSHLRLVMGGGLVYIIAVNSGCLVLKAEQT
jgi:hypothetical protein